MPLRYFTKNIDPILTVDRKKIFVFYDNSRLLIDRTSERYGKWLDKSTHCLDYLKITGPIEKRGRVSYDPVFL